MIPEFIKDFPHHWSSKVHDYWAVIAVAATAAISRADIMFWMQVTSLAMGMVFLALGIYMRWRRIRDADLGD